jgi:hypothetical protein
MGSEQEGSGQQQSAEGRAGEAMTGMEMPAQLQFRAPAFWKHACCLLLAVPKAGFQPGIRCSSYSRNWEWLESLGEPTGLQVLPGKSAPMKE